MAIDYKWFEEMEARIPKGEVRTRFAPSPTGYMHVGGLRTALYAWLIAKHTENGKFLLRIEDTDQGRYVDGSIEVIYRTMLDSGLIYDEGPDVGGPVGPYIQTERRDIYMRYAELLIEKGGAYRCFCTEERLNELKNSDANAKYDGHCAQLSQEDIDKLLEQNVPYVIRQKIPREGHTTFSDCIFGDITVENSTLDDNVLIKSDGLPTYNFANVVDDHLMGITHVVRGSEYLSSTPKYNLLYESFGWELPVYIHCSPVMKDATHKLSKRNGDPTYDDLLNMGYIRSAIINYVALLGWSPGGEQELFSLDELKNVFNISGISKSPAIFDMAKLDWFNSEYIRAMTPDEFYAAAFPYLEQNIKNPAINKAEVAALLQQRCEKLTDIAEKVDFFDTLPQYDIELFVHKKSKTNLENSLDALQSIYTVLEALPSWDKDSIHDSLMELASAKEVKNSIILWPLRIAVSGKSVTPGGGIELCTILGKNETLSRIKLGIEKLSK